MQLANLRPKAVSFNFLVGCNMACPYCYCPFDRQHSSWPMWFRIVDRLAEWDIEAITFGGGDPFMFEDFPRLLEHTSARFHGTILIHVDTNGLGITPKLYPVIKSTIGLLGIPIDGSTPSIHDTARQYPGHLELVLRLLSDLTAPDLDIPLKVNTLVNRQNVSDLENIAKLLGLFPVRLWSLYEFWAIGANALTNRRPYELSNADYFAATRDLKTAHPGLAIEIGQITSRWHSYLFVSGAGRAYTVAKENPHEYIELGSIFDADVLERWLAHSNPSDTEARLRSRLKVLGD